MDKEVVYKKYWPMVFRRCQQMLGDADAAADAAQEVFAKILEKQVDTNVEHLTRLLWRMATNRCLNVIYSHANQTKAPNGDTLLERIACANDVEAKYMSRGVLRKLFEKHPESTRVIAVLHFLDGMTLKETAREVQMSVSGVRKRLRALRETLVELEDV